MATTSKCTPKSATERSSHNSAFIATAGQAARKGGAATQTDICLPHLFTSALIQFPTKRLSPSADPPSLTNLAFVNWSVECGACPGTKDPFQFTAIKSGMLRRSSFLVLCAEGAMTSQGASTVMVRPVRAQEVQAHLGRLVSVLQLALPFLILTPVLLALPSTKNAAFGLCHLSTPCFPGR